MKQIRLNDEQFRSLEELEVFLRMLGRIDPERFASQAMEFREALQVFADVVESILEVGRDNGE